MPTLTFSAPTPDITQSLKIPFPQSKTTKLYCKHFWIKAISFFYALVHKKTDKIMIKQ